MPSKSKPQHDFMAAIAHDPRFARKAGVPVSVGQEFFNADKKAKNFASGGPVQGPLTQSRNLLTQTNVLPSDVDNSNLRESLPRVYGALAGLMGTAPDQLEGSVMEPGYDARKQGAAMTFPIGTALQMLPGLKGLATAMAAEKMVPSGSLAAQRGAITWHGSPHNFDAFDASKIGTGEGAQAYGHGLYLAENPVVAGGYQTALSDKALISKIKGIYGPDDDYSDVSRLIAQDTSLTPPQRELLDSVQSEGNFGFDYPHQAVQQLLRNPAQYDIDPRTQAALNNLGSLYKVDTPDTHIAKMLDWDKPLSDQHPDVQALLINHPAITQDVAERAGIQQRLNDQFPTRLTHPVLGPIASRAITPEGTSGQQAYDTLASQFGSRAAASQFLSDQGIPGIKYLDGGSRGAGTGTSNYVVFPGEERNLTILYRNGVPTGNVPPSATTAPTGPETSNMIADTPPQPFAKGGLVLLDHMIRHHILQHTDPMTLTPDDHAFMGQMADSGVGS
jgi:hypothetical protein